MFPIESSERKQVHDMRKTSRASDWPTDQPTLQYNSDKKQKTPVELINE